MCIIIILYNIYNKNRIYYIIMHFTMIQYRLYIDVIFQQIKL